MQTGTATVHIVLLGVPADGTFSFRYKPGNVFLRQVPAITRLPEL